MISDRTAPRHDERSSVRERSTIEDKWQTRKNYSDMSDIPAAVGPLFQRLDGSLHK